MKTVFLLLQFISFVLLCYICLEVEMNTLDGAIKSCDSSYSDFKEVYNILAEALRNSTNTDKMVQLISKAQGKVLELAAKSK